MDLLSWLSEVSGAIGGWWFAAGWPWISAWMQTSGFGGAAAVLAATIAFAGVRRQTRLNAWWQRAEWALDLMSHDGATEEQIDTGLIALRALQKSRLAKKDEQKFLAGITQSTLDPEGDGSEEEGLASPVADPSPTAGELSPPAPDAVLATRVPNQANPDGHLTGQSDAARDAIDLPRPTDAAADAKVARVFATDAGENKSAASTAQARDKRILGIRQWFTRGGQR